MNQKDKEIDLADRGRVKSLNKLLAGSGYQVKVAKKGARVYNEDGVFLFRARSLVAAVLRIWQ